MCRWMRRRSREVVGCGRGLVFVFVFSFFIHNSCSLLFLRAAAHAHGELRHRPNLSQDVRDFTVVTAYGLATSHHPFVPVAFQSSGLHPSLDSPVRWIGQSRKSPSLPSSQEVWFHHHILLMKQSHMEEGRHRCWRHLPRWNHPSLWLG